MAEAAADAYPERCADILVERACDLIEQRGRGNYAETAGHLSTVRDIYRRAGDTTAWPPTIETIREEYDNLPALQDEIDKADL